MASFFSKTKFSLMDKIKLAIKKDVDEDIFEDLIESLILSDVSYELAENIIENARLKLKNSQVGNYDDVRDAVINSATELFSRIDKFETPKAPCIIFVMGVNGVGKTTTIAKLTNILLKENKTVLLAAADTFRAAACEQLCIWADRLSVPIIKSLEGQDPASVVYDAVNSMKSRKYDYLICDTAGRLHNKKGLMDELKKMYSVCDKEASNCNVITTLVLDAMSGQNSISQFEKFSEVANVSNIIVTKTEGTAKGGIILSIANNHDVPISYLGVGEGIEDIIEFDAREYIESIF